MKILLTGKNGQVGYELARSLQGLDEIVAVDRSQMDLSNLDQVRDVIRTDKPNLIINPAKGAKDTQEWWQRSGTYHMATQWQTTW